MRETADWATIVCVVAACAGILGLARGQLTDASTIGLRAGRFEDGADRAHVRDEGRPIRNRVGEFSCVEPRLGHLYGFSCDETLATARIFTAPNEVRRAMNLRPCWWHADVDDVARVRGVTWSYAALAIKLRNEHWPMPLEQIKIRDELGSRGPKIAEAFTDDCSLSSYP